MIDYISQHFPIFTSAIAAAISVISIISSIVTNVKSSREISKMKYDLIANQVNTIHSFSRLRIEADKILADILNSFKNKKITKNSVIKSLDRYAIEYLETKQDLLQAKISMLANKRNIIQKVIIDDIFSILEWIAKLQKYSHDYDNGNDYFNQNHIYDLSYIVEEYTSVLFTPAVRRTYNEYVEKIPVNDRSYAFKKLPVTPWGAFFISLRNFVWKILYGYFGLLKSPYMG